MKRIPRWLMLASVAALITSSIGCSSAAGFTESDSAEINWPDAPVAAAVAASSGGVILSSNDSGPRQLASTVKLLTAILVLEKMPLKPGESGEKFMITGEDASLTAQIATRDGIVIPVGIGGEISQRSLLAGVLLVSANNYTDILVRHTFGSQDVFLDVAEEWAEKHGLETLHLADASGLSPETIGTAQDLIVIAREALAVPVIAEMVGSQTFNSDGATFENTNLLLSDPSFVGMKTGHLATTFQNLVFARIDGQGNVVVGAVLGETSAGAARESAKGLSASALALF